MIYISLYIPVYNNRYISWWMYFVAGLSLVLQQPSTAVLPNQRQISQKRALIVTRLIVLSCLSSVRTFLSSQPDYKVSSQQGSLLKCWQIVFQFFLFSSTLIFMIFAFNFTRAASFWRKPVSSGANWQLAQCFNLG